MPYFIDRLRAVWMQELVAIVKVRERWGRSLLIQRDNSLHRSFTRPQTLARRANAPRIREALNIVTKMSFEKGT